MQLVERHKIQRNHPYQQETGTLRLLVCKPHHQTKSHIYASLIFPEYNHKVDYLSSKLKYLTRLRNVLAQNRKTALLSWQDYKLQLLFATYQYNRYQYKFYSKNQLSKYILSQDNKYKYPIQSKDFWFYPDDRESQQQFKTKADFIKLSRKILKKILHNDSSDNLYEDGNDPPHSHFEVGVICKNQELDCDINRNAIAKNNSGIAKIATLVKNRIAIVVIVKKTIFNSVYRSYSWYNQVRYNPTSLLPTSQSINKILRSLTPKRISPVESYLYQASQLMSDPITKNRIINFHSQNNSLDQHYGKLSGEDHYKPWLNNLEKFIKHWICQLTIWVKKVLCDDFQGYRFSCCDPKQETTSRNVQSDAYWTKYSGQKIKTKLYKSGISLLIHADINDSLNFSRKLVPKAFS